MRILLLHPDDSPRRGPWAREKWDLIVDLGKSSESTAEAWQTLSHCPVTRLQSFRRTIDDPRQAGEILRTGFGQLLDSAGLDWWELTSLYVHEELETAQAMRRLVAGSDLKGELFATRSGWPVSGFAALCGAEVHSFSDSAQRSVTGRVRHYARAVARLTLSQALDVAGDKYDASYRWRSRFRRRPERASTPVVLLPSAYTNVSRGSTVYASLLPEQKFLLVATRRSALSFDRVPNVRVSHLSGYVGSGRSVREYEQLAGEWNVLRNKLEAAPDLALLNRTGVLDPLPQWLRTGIAVRDAWQNVLEREPVMAVLCGDDSNWHTRLPVALARKRNLPTIDFHHGALDGRFLLKDLPSEFYLAKNEMERDYLTRVCALPADRVLLGSTRPAAAVEGQRGPGDRLNVVFFSEPYESVGGRPEEIYRELLPPLSRLALEFERTLVVKLHPFESLPERRRLVEAALGRELAGKVKIVIGALSRDLLASAWFGITVESSTVLDCARNGVPCFHCLWLVGTLTGYGQQFTRFQIGRLLRSVDEVAEIPRLLAEAGLPEEPSAEPGTRPAAEILRSVFSGRGVPASR